MCHHIKKAIFEKLFNFGLVVFVSIKLDKNWEKKVYLMVKSKIIGENRAKIRNFLQFFTYYLVLCTSEDVVKNWLHQILIKYHIFKDF